MIPQFIGIFTNVFLVPVEVLGEDGR